MQRLTKRYKCDNCDKCDNRYKPDWKDTGLLQTAEKLGRMQATNFRDETPMEYAYRADTWQALYAAVAGSAAALTGLLFIGLSLNLRIIVKTPEHTARARETFGGLLSLLVLFIREGTQRYKRYK